MLFPTTPSSQVPSPRPENHVLPGLLWLWITLVVFAAYLVPPPLAGFEAHGESGRLVFFHVPMAWTSFVAFLAAGIWSALYLRTHRPRYDRAAHAAVVIGLLFCLLATLTGALWADLHWPSFWSWDPRQLSITVALAYYGAYLALRRYLGDPEVRARVSGAYALLGLVAAPFLFFGAPRVAVFSLHPQPVINTGTLTAHQAPAMAPAGIAVLAAGALGFIALAFWLHDLTTRLAALEERKASA